MKTCPFCNSIKAEDWRLHLLDHGSAKIVDKTIGFDSLSMQEYLSIGSVLAKLHEWMGTFQMNTKAICADMAFHQSHDMQAFNRMHNVKRLPTGPRTPWPNRSEMGVRLFKNFSWHWWIQSPKTWTQITAQLMLKAATVRNSKTPWNWPLDENQEISWTSFHNPERLTSTPTKQVLLNEEIQNWLFRFILKFNNEKTSAEILLNE